MIKAITPLQAKIFDARAKQIYGVSSLILMENAGRTVAEEILKLKKKKIAIFCGRGNNGGDGFVCARHLLTKGVNPDVFLVGKIEEVKNEARVNLEILLRLKLKVVEINKRNLSMVKKKISKYDLIVDALFGTGLSGKVKGIYRDLIEMFNSSSAYILSIDIPSGLDGNSGEILGCCVKADKTITFLAPKLGMIKNKGPQYCGKVEIRELGVPIAKLLEEKF